MATHLQFINGKKIPTIAWGSAGKFDETLNSLLNTALEAGYRHIDTACFYRNEELVGNALKEWFSSGKLKREDVFITTKLPPHHLYPEKIEESLKISLKKLQLDYVDLYLIHLPIRLEFLEDFDNGPRKSKRGIPPAKAMPTDHIACWKKLEEQFDAGRVKNIGLSNFNVKQIDRIWQAARVKPSGLQVEISPFLQQPDLVNFCQSKGIIVEGYSMVRKPAEEEGKLYDIYENETIKKIAEKHNKPPALVVMRYFIQKKVIPILGTTNPERVKQNLQVYSFSLDDEDVNALDKLDVGEKARKANFLADQPMYVEHPEYPFPK